MRDACDKPVRALTGTGSPDDRVEAVSSGACGGCSGARALQHTNPAFRGPGTNTPAARRRLIHDRRSTDAADRGRRKTPRRGRGIREPSFLPVAPDNRDAKPRGASRVPGPSIGPRTTASRMARASPNANAWQTPHLSSHKWGGAAGAGTYLLLKDGRAAGRLPIHGRRGGGLRAFRAARPRPL